MAETLDLRRWQQLCRTLGIVSQPAIEQEFQHVVSAYGESQRAYHTSFSKAV